jgi:phage protein U
MGLLPAAIPLIGGWSTVGVIGGALGIAGLAASTKAQVQSVQADNRAADYNAAAAMQNAALAQQQAADAKARGEEDAKRLRMQTEQLKGDQRARIAASGVLVDDDSGAGDTLDTLATTAMRGKDDESLLLSNAAREAWGFQVQSTNYQQQAQLAKMSKTNPYTAAAGGLLTGTSSLLARV